MQPRAGILWYTMARGRKGARGMWQESLYPEEKKELHSVLQKQLDGLVDGERDAVANMANLSALLFGTLKQINWAGFYIMKEGMLVLGPFQGAPACLRIPLGRGVCGTAAQTGRTQRVADVHAFPGHIACDARSQSEIVIPLWSGEKIVAVLDIDSPVKNRFDEEDQAGLEALAQRLAAACDWRF